MAGNTFGILFTVTTWGESHGDSIGCIIDGCPAGMKINIEAITNIVPIYPNISINIALSIINYSPLR